MDKNPESKSGASQARTDTMLSNVNTVIQASVRMTLLAANLNCKCVVCREARALGPNVAKILELGSQRGTPRALDTGQAKRSA